MIRLKDESSHFGLPGSKALGGPYAVGIVVHVRPSGAMTQAGCCYLQPKR